MELPLIELREIVKSFGSHTILNGVNLRIFRGEILTLIGKSGGGKSVLLKHIVGLLTPDSGDILFQGQPLASFNRGQRREFKRRISYMFQNNALFDSMTVFENIALPLIEKLRLPKEEVSKRVMAKVEQLELREVVEKFPSQISGGMQKRVALARALIMEPEIVLFDEPTTGLDPLRKNAVLGMIAQYQKQFGFTAVVVSHDIPDVFFISNRVAIIDGGKIIFEGTPIELEQNEEPVVQQFLHGEQALKDALTGLNTRSDLERRVRVELGRMSKYQDVFSILLFYVGDLQKITEHVGQITGHRILKCLGGVLKEHIGTSGMSARYSANEILTVLPHCSLDDARRMLDDIKEDLQHKAIMQPEEYPRACMDFCVKAGLAQAIRGTTLERLIEEARSNMETIAELRCNRGGQER